jgi:seryl-tRNA synthetase
MIQINTIKQQADHVKARLQIKNFKNLQLVDAIIAIDEQRRAIQKQNDDLAAEANAKSKQIGQLMATGNKAEADELKASVAASKNQAKQLAQQLGQLEQQQSDLLVQLPNLPHSSVPQGTTAADNEEVGNWGAIPTLPQDALPHWDLASKHQLIDFELGTKITGSGFPVYTNQGAKLQRALINFFLDYNTQAGYVEYLPPLMVNEDTAYATGQLPDKEGQMYHVTADGFYLIPTAEVPVTNVYRDVIFAEADLPKKMTAYTHPALGVRQVAMVKM